jgi:hypothetical protein
MQGLLWYLYGPGRRNEHVNPRLAAGWRHPDELEPPRRADGKRDFTRLAGLMEMPLALLGGQAPDNYVWHVSIRASDIDPDLGDGAWADIAARIMDRTGLSPSGEQNHACPWVAVHHGDNHIHLVTVLARLDGRSCGPHNDYYRIGEILTEIEDEYGLEPTAARDRTANCRPTPAETRKAAAAGLPEAPRITLQRHTASAAAAARSEPEFFDGLRNRGVRIRLYRNPARPDDILGYSVGLRGDLNAAGSQIWFRGRNLAADLALPKLRARWPVPVPPARRGTPASLRRGTSRKRHLSRPVPRARLSGAGMTNGSARAALRAQVQSASAAGNEDEFFRALTAAGMMVQAWPDRRRSRRAGGYMVSLPGLMHHRDGKQVWYQGETLDPSLALPVLRRAWRNSGSLPAARLNLPYGSEIRDVYAYAAAVAIDAASRLGQARGRDAADIAWAAADLLICVASATGNPELRAAADGFTRSGRCAWGRTPEPSDHGLSLRTAAWLLAVTGPGSGSTDAEDRAVTAAMITAIAGLAQAVARLRAEQNRLLQAGTARETAAGLEASGAAIHPASGQRAPASRQAPSRTREHAAPSRQETPSSRA